MNVILFQNRFVVPILKGTKWQTCRLHRKDGSLRVWVGAPYRSKQREIARALVTEVESVSIWQDGISFGDGTARVWWCDVDRRPDVLDSFARRDGFTCFQTLAAWFKEMHGLPFRGSVIEWRLLS
jgi:hypothetical protein